jgi:hypothetical protein
MSDAISHLFASRKFLLMLLDLVVSVSTYFIGKYANPAAAQDMLFLITAMQPVFVTVIAGIAYEDGQEKRADTYYIEEPEDPKPVQ